MPTLILILQIVVLFAVVFLLVRKSPAPQQDPRLVQLADTLPTQFARLDARSESLDHHLRNELAQLRTDIATEAQRTREGSATDFTALRTEITASIAALGQTLQTGLAGFRADNKSSDDLLRNAVQRQMDSITQRISSFTSETTEKQTALRESLNAKLNDLMNSNTGHQNLLRTSVEERLTKLNEANSAKLEEMRVTVDEKLHATLQTRLTESFGQVTDQLNKVHTGLGEMTKLSDGVNGLSRIFTNVKTRGNVGEVMLETLLKQMLAPNQYIQNARVKLNTQEMVEFAVKLPTPQGELLLPIDSKFPSDIWERLQTAYETGLDVVSAGKIFEATIRNEGRKICEKYLSPPTTTSFAIMFLPSEALYAEVMRRDGLQSDIQQNCQVTIAGPSTLSAILSSFQMGFHMLQLQKKGDEVWKVLAGARTEFGKFEQLMTKMDDQVTKVQKTIQAVGTRARAINRTLRDVSEPDKTLPISQQIDFDQAAGITTFLAASGDDE
jgi:DNA recombination protein RmuC